jgi:MFS family permease
MTEENLGNPVVIGMIMSVMTIGSILSSVVFGFLYSKLKYFTICIGWGAYALGGLLIYFIPTLASCAAAEILVGIGMGLGSPFFSMAVTSITPKSKTTMGIAIVGLGVNAGIFLSAFTTSAILFFMPGASTRQQFLVPSIGFIILMFFGAWFSYTHRRGEIDIKPPSPPVGIHD